MKDDQPSVIPFPVKKQDPLRDAAPEQGNGLFETLKAALESATPVVQAPDEPSPARQAPQLKESMACPACESEVPIHAAVCLNCGNDVQRHLQAIHAEMVKARAQRLKLPAAILMLSAFLLLPFGIVNGFGIVWGILCGAVLVGLTGITVLYRRLGNPTWP
ncbi:Uncharacterised protein [Achromobacter insolitus]|uniref:hypothetical protein n=1 Tax=Achromobacter insolitus TaxID=217204 RepID=UPI00097287E7|nr:hypothetical protein [Achromobacter insolitus]APX77303.1 hypothetical protein BUW96_22355 [Achromobacter insolitus]OWT54980.1 hypothetical protein CEY08_25620 [Achromobacter insolitus]CAB3677864.1 hypothetical protein LMG6003_01441 [Achromobacter insolitus]VEG72375.1 Uncharacterised protein [Achromobacter insolitus]